jgi:hypothetical protein
MLSNSRSVNVQLLKLLCLDAIAGKWTPVAGSRAITAYRSILNAETEAVFDATLAIVSEADCLPSKKLLELCAPALRARYAAEESEFNLNYLHEFLAACKSIIKFCDDETCRLG